VSGRHGASAGAALVDAAACGAFSGIEHKRMLEYCLLFVNLTTSQSLPPRAINALSPKIARAVMLVVGLHSAKDQILPCCSSATLSWDVPCACAPGARLARRRTPRPRRDGKAVHACVETRLVPCLLALRSCLPLVALRHRPDFEIVPENTSKNSALNHSTRLPGTDCAFSVQNNSTKRLYPPVK